MSEPMLMKKKYDRSYSKEERRKERQPPLPLIPTDDLYLSGVELVDDLLVYSINTRYFAVIFRNGKILIDNRDELKTTKQEKDRMMRYVKRTVLGHLFPTAPPRSRAKTV